MNVLLITADQFRADCLSAAGHPTVLTPAIDRLAEDGVRFTRHFGQCPPCGPSRTSLLTGMYQMNHRSVQNGTPLDASFTNLAEMVRTVGYTPWVIGYTDTSMDPRKFHPRDPRAGHYSQMLPGIEQFSPGSELASRDPDWKLRLKELGYANWDTPFRQEVVEPALAARGPTYAPITLKAQHSDTAYTADRAMRFLRMHEGNPWFLHVSFLRPHPPFVATRPWHDMYHPDDVPDFHALPTLDDEKAFHPFMPFRLARLEMEPELPLDGPHPNDNIAWRQARATYYGLVSEIDHHVGRIIDQLKELGEYEKTLIVFTSDHGEMLGDHWCWGKETPFDQAVHVPLVVRSPVTPSAGRGRVVEDFSEHIDIMPTILDHLGAEIPLQCDGRSLRTFIEGSMPARWRDDVRWEFDFRSVTDESAEQHFGISIDECSLAVVRTRGEKYVHFAALPALYFDLAADPGELNNLAANPEHATDMLAMAQRMLTWRMAFNRRELTGIRMARGTQFHADRSRRIV